MSYVAIINEAHSAQTTFQQFFSELTMKQKKPLANVGISAVMVFVLLLVNVGTAAADNPAYDFAKHIGSTGSDQSHDLVVDADGNLYVTGGFVGTVDFDPGSGTAELTSFANGGVYEKDIFVASYDASGNYRWAFKAGGVPPSGMSNDNYGTSIAIDANNNVVVCGLFLGSIDCDPSSGTATLSSPGWSTFVAKYNSAGSYQWAFRLGAYTSTQPSVAIDANNNVIVAGTFSGAWDFDPGSGTQTLTSTKVSKKGNAAYSLDIYVAKYSASGTYAWAFRVGSSSVGTYSEYAHEVDVDDNSNIYLTGKLDIGTSINVDFNPGSGTANLTGPGLYLAKYTSTGAYAWATKISGDFNIPSQIAVADDGNVVLSGGFKSTVDFDPSSGTANLTGNATKYTVFVAGYSSSGAYQWAFSPSVGLSEEAYIDGNGNVYVAGTFSGVNDFDPGSGSVALDTTSVGFGGFLASYDATGAYRWAFPLNDSGWASARGIAVTGSGDIYLSGNLRLRADFDPSSSSALLTSAGSHDIFLAHYTEASAPRMEQDPVAGINDDKRSMHFAVGPNPFTSVLTLRLGDEIASGLVTVMDMMGQMVESHSIHGTSDITIGSDLSSGMYFVRILSGSTTQQFVIHKTK